MGEGILLGDLELPEGVSALGNPKSRAISVGTSRITAKADEETESGDAAAGIQPEPSTAAERAAGHHLRREPLGLEHELAVLLVPGHGEAEEEEVEKIQN